MAAKNSVCLSYLDLDLVGWYSWTIVWFPVQIGIFIGTQVIDFLMHVTVSTGVNVQEMVWNEPVIQEIV